MATGANGGGGVDFFLKIDGIEGESTDAKHAKEIDVLSWQWGATQSGALQPRAEAVGSGRGKGKVEIADLSVSMRMSKASPKLMLACATGEHLKKAVLVARKAGGAQEEYYTVTLSDVLVSGYQTSAVPAGGSIPIDAVTLAASKIEVEYKPQDE